MGLDKLKKKKKPHQLVKKRKDGKRPGYYGPDEGFGDYDDSPSSSGGGGGGSDNGGGYDYEYVAYNPPAPAPAPAPAPSPSFDYESEAYDITPSPDYETDLEEIGKDTGYVTLLKGKDRTEAKLGELVDFALNTEGANFVNPLDEFGIKGAVYADTVYDDGESLYTSPTQRTKEREPYYSYTPGPNYVTADELSRLNRGIGDSDERISTLAKIQAVNPIQQPTGILQTAGTKLKNMAIDYALNAFTGGLYGRFKTPYKIAQAVDNRFFDDKIPGITKFAKYNKNPTSGYQKNTFESDGDNRPIPKDVITANVQKFSPEKINRAIALRDQLQSYAEAGRLNEKGQLTLQQLNNLIEQYQVSV